MNLPREGCLLRVFVGESTLAGHQPAFEAIVLKARELGLAGATVLRGIMGYGATSKIHAAHVLSLSADLPVIVEIVDTREKIDLLLPFIDAVVTDGLVTLERAEVIYYRAVDRRGRS
jgi:PII-like signaling protein